MVDPDVIEYYRGLERSDLPRIYLSGRSPEDPDELWFFEAVDVDGEVIAISQVTVMADGTRHRYSADHIEDEWGFLTDQAIDYEEQLTECDAAAFDEAWQGGAT